MSLLRSLMASNSSHVSGDYPTVSLEEEMIAETTAGQEVAEADATGEAIERLQQQAETVQDTADYVDATVNASEGGATQNEAVLLEQVGDLATAGTGSTAEDVIPAIESYVGSQVSTEGMREMVRNFWAAIKAAVKKVWDLLVSYYRKMTSRLGSVVKAAKELKEKADKATSKSPGDNKKIKVSSTNVGLLSTDKKIGSAGDIKSNVEALFTQVDHAINGWAQKVATAGKDIADIMKDVDEDNTGDKLNALNGKVKGIMSALPSGYSSSSDKRFNESGVTLTVSSVLAGDKALFIKKKEGQVPTDNLTAAAFHQYTEWFMTSASDKNKDFGEVDIDIMTPNLTSGLASEIIASCDKIRNYSEGKGFSELEKQRKAIESAGDKAGERVSKLENGTQSEDKGENAKKAAALKNLRAIQRYASAYSKWSKNPAMSLTNHMLSVMRAAIAVGNSSMAKYS